MPAYYLLATYAPSATGVMRQQQGLLLIGIGQAHQIDLLPVLCDTGTTGDSTTPSSKPTAVPTSNTSRAYEPYTTYGGYALLATLVL